MLFIIYGLLNNEQKKYFIFPAKIHFIVYLICAISVGCFFNNDYQLFCIPVKWTKIALIIFSIFLVVILFLKGKIFDNFLNPLVLGVGLFISVYIIIFGGIEYLFWLGFQSLFIVPIYFISRFLNKKYLTRIFDSFNFYGAVILLPYIFVIWIIWQVWNKKLRNKLSVLILPICLTIFGLLMTFRMNNIINKINYSCDKVTTAKIIIDNPVDEYLTELILGAHWKYHTKFCLYDGWRPPFHDPILGFAQPILYFGKQFNYEISLHDRINLYKQVFPKNNVTFNCKCAKNERLYLNSIR
ncbi:MAG: hypothetical protein K9J13_09515 [Saprospiraceae bacterium]|nr:hypothetical protein [Saprospiraceae bacterium]